MNDFAKRLEALRQKMLENGLDGLLITHPTNRRYLTGFSADDTPPDESSGHLLITEKSALLITGSVNVTQAEAQAPHIEVVKRETSWSDDNAKAIMAADIHRLGYESNAMLEGVFRKINEAVNEAGHRLEWVDVAGIVDELRAVKTESELALLRKAFEITCAAFNEAAESIRVGDTEQEIAWRIHSAMVRLGAEGPAFPTIVAAGTNAARPHHEPGSTVIEEGMPIIIDMGANFAGYCADLTRTVWVGEPDKRLQELYPIVADAVEAVFERCNPGVTGQELDQAARDHIDTFGYGDAFSHGLGHGVGLRVHEGPSASKNSADIMQAGNLLTIEPGVYFPEWGGIRVEDAILFNDEGFEVLTSAAAKNKIV